MLHVNEFTVTELLSPVGHLLGHYMCVNVDLHVEAKAEVMAKVEVEVGILTPGTYQPTTIIY